MRDKEDSGRSRKATRAATQRRIRAVSPPAPVTRRRRGGQRSGGIHMNRLWLSEPAESTPPLPFIPSSVAGPHQREPTPLLGHHRASQLTYRPPDLPRAALQRCNVAHKHS